MTAPALAVYRQGLNAVSGDNLNSFEQTCDTFAQIRAIVGVSGMQIFTRGRTATADGFQGIFFWDATSTADDDNIDVIKPTGAPTAGRWIRISFGSSFLQAGTGAILRSQQDKSRERLSVADFGAVGQGANESIQIQLALNAGASVGRAVWFPYTLLGYRFQNVIVPIGVDLIFENHVQIAAPTGSSAQIMQLLGGNTWRGGTLEGQNANTRLIICGSDTNPTATRIRIDDLHVQNCAYQSLSAAIYLTDWVITNCVFTTSKPFNTNDASTMQRFIFSDNIVENISGEGALLDFPAVTNITTSAVIADNVWQIGPTKLVVANARCLGLARCVDVTVTGNIFIGSAIGEDLVHFEDKAEHMVIANNIFRANGNRECLDGALGGDPTYPQTDRAPKYIAITGNQFFGAGTESTHLAGGCVWIEGSSANGFYTFVTFTDNEIFDAPWPLTIFGASCTVEDNKLFNCLNSVRVRAPVDPVVVENASKGALTNRIRRNDYLNPGWAFPDLQQGIGATSLFAYNFGDSGASVTTTGTTGTVAYPTDATSGRVYLQFTGSSSGTERLLNITIPTTYAQPGDSVSIELMTRASAQNNGQAAIQFVGSGQSVARVTLNDGTNYADWKIDGAVYTLANAFGHTPGTVSAIISLSANVPNGGTLDIAWIRVRLANSGLIDS